MRTCKNITTIQLQHLVFFNNVFISWNIESITNFQPSHKTSNYFLVFELGFKYYYILWLIDYIKFLLSCRFPVHSFFFFFATHLLKELDCPVDFSMVWIMLNASPCCSFIWSSATVYPINSGCSFFGNIVSLIGYLYIQKKAHVQMCMCVFIYTKYM